MENRCVVCGSESGLTRHHIVPHCYRQFFPIDFKNHRSYDVLPMCIECHRLYEEVALEFKKLLAEKYSSPLGGSGLKVDRALAHARGSAYALLNHTIPPARAGELSDIVEQYLKKKATKEDMQVLIEMNIRDKSNYVHHGKKVMEQIQDLEGFIREWRQHFHIIYVTKVFTKILDN